MSDVLRDCLARTSFVLTRSMSDLPYQVSPADPTTYASVAVTLTAVALLASYRPARRPASVDPIQALRDD
jgi:ABC-type lipoprotein release transport system permease subunit